jgi:hypothetical protein
VSTTTRSRLQSSTRRPQENNWPHDQVRSSATGRVAARAEKPNVLRFPDTGTALMRGPDAVAHRLTTVQSTWSDYEREFRRLRAIRKQEELLMLLAGAELEDEMRLAVANGEQPIVPPEIALLRN